MLQRLDSERDGLPDVDTLRVWITSERALENADDVLGVIISAESHSDILDKLDLDLGRFLAFLEEWGSTMDMFVQDLPSWRENPATPLALIRREADQPDSESPLAATARSLSPSSSKSPLATASGLLPTSIVAYSSKSWSPRFRKS